MRTGIDFFTNSCFKEAAEYFTEVIRLVCEFNFVREAYIYQAKCLAKLVSSTITALKMCCCLMTLRCNENKIIFKLVQVRKHQSYRRDNLVYSLHINGPSTVYYSKCT